MWVKVTTIIITDILSETLVANHHRLHLWKEYRIVLKGDRDERETAEKIDGVYYRVFDDCVRDTWKNVSKLYSGIRKDKHAEGRGALGVEYDDLRSDSRSCLWHSIPVRPKKGLTKFLQELAKNGTFQGFSKDNLLKSLEMDFGTVIALIRVMGQELGKIKISELLKKRLDKKTDYAIMFVTEGK